MKDILLVIALLFAVGLSVVLVRFNEKAVKATKSLEEERYSRMVAEESLQRNSSKASALEAQLKAAEAKINKIQDILDQEQNVNSDLKKQYEKLTQTKAELEEKLKATLQAAAQPAAVPADAPAPAAVAPAEVKAQQ